MFEDALIDVTNRGELVLPFLGLGTTLIAAENTGRVCCGVEPDSLYVDVITLSDVNGERCHSGWYRRNFRTDTGVTTIAYRTLSHQSPFARAWRAAPNCPRGSYA